MVEKDISSCHKHGTKKKFYFFTVSTGDFGISRILMGTSDMATTFTGTPYYMSPEVLKHEGYKYKSDIWYDFVHHGEHPSRPFINLQLELETQVFGNWHTIKLQEVGDIGDK